MNKALATLFFIATIFISMSASDNKFLNNEFKIHDVTLIATNAQELAKFYSKIGFGRAPHVNNESIVVFPMPENDFVIHTGKKNSKNHLSFKISNIELVIKKLKAEKIEFTELKQLRPGFLGILIIDPNGNKVEFLTPQKS
jgi:hypothetical protein